MKTNKSCFNQGPHQPKKGKQKRNEYFNDEYFEDDYER